MNMLDNPKKKSKMWTSIAEELKAMGIEVNIIINSLRASVSFFLTIGKQ